MQGISNLNVTVAGGGLPVDPIDLDDFEGVLGDLSVAAKVPGIVVQAKAAQFTVMFIPERASVQVDAPLPENAEAKMLDAMRFYLKEYAGRRSVTGLGHNFQGELDCGEATGRQVLDSLLNAEKLRSVLKAQPGAGNVTMFFERGAETRAQLTLGVREGGAHAIEWSFNFHYDLKQPESLDVFEALDRFSASRALAEESVEAMQMWREGG